MTTPINPTPTTDTPQPESRWCDACGTYVPQYRTPGGEWFCGAGHNMSAALDRDFQLSAKVGDAARLFLGMSQSERRKWLALFVECLGPVAQDLRDAAGRSDF